MSLKDKLLNPKMAAALGCLFVLVCGFGLLNVNSRFGNSLRNASYDWLYDLPFVKLRSPTPDAINMVYLDEASYIDLNQPFNQPWDRAIHARLLDKLTADGVRAVIFDIVFSDPGPNPDSDKLLADAIRRNGHVILAADYSENQSSATARSRSKEKTLVTPFPLFSEAAAAWGIAQLQPDEDFLVREHNHGPRDETFTSMTWAAARMMNVPAAAKNEDRFRERWINYYGGPDNFPSMSYKLAFDKPSGFFKDKVVFVGGRPQTGMLRERKDQFRSPYTTWYSDPVFIPAVDVHATILLNLMGGDWLRRLPPFAEWLAIFLAALFFGAGLMRFQPSFAVGVTVLGILCFTIAAIVLFGTTRLWFPWMIIVAAQAPLGLLFTISYKSLEWYVTRRKLELQREQAYRQIHEQAALLDKAQDAIMVHDLNWHSTYWNPSAERLCGWNANEAKTQSVAELLYKNDAEKFSNAREAVMKNGEWIGQLRQTTKSGKEILVESRWTLVRGADGKPNSVLVINTDITERSKLESQLLRSQRLEGIGTLASGIAHDLNNVLTPILLGVEILSAGEQKEARKKTLNSIGTSARRGADMVKQILSFSRGHQGEKSPLQLKHVVRDLEKILRETFPPSLAIDVLLGNNLSPILGDVTQLHQVLLNLCVNARDAMPKGGNIFISVENVVLSESEAKQFPGALPGGFVRLKVQDTGMGIPQEIIDRIFEPFFTTKEVGKGTGLGLSTVANIVKNHGGFLDVSSAVGKGTTFTILFPACETAVAQPTTETKTSHAVGAGKTVLVVDDEPLIRNLLNDVLTGNGYRILLAENGALALEVFKQHGSEIHVVIMDMMMPVLDGYEAIAQMQRLRPNTPFVAMSGMMQPAKLSQAAPDAKVELLHKPFTVPQVFETLTRLN